MRAAVTGWPSSSSSRSRTSRANPNVSPSGQSFFAYTTAWLCPVRSSLVTSMDTSQAAQQRSVSAHACRIILDLVVDCADVRVSALGNPVHAGNEPSHVVRPVFVVIPECPRKGINDDEIGADLPGGRNHVVDGVGVIQEVGCLDYVMEAWRISVPCCEGADTLRKLPDTLEADVKHRRLPDAPA
jgi:hypothetical protein